MFVQHQSCDRQDVRRLSCVSSIPYLQQPDGCVWVRSVCLGLPGRVAPRFSPNLLELAWRKFTKKWTTHAKFIEPQGLKMLKGSLIFVVQCCQCLYRKGSSTFDHWRLCWALLMSSQKTYGPCGCLSNLKWPPMQRKTHTHTPLFTQYCENNCVLPPRAFWCVFTGLFRGRVAERRQPHLLRRWTGSDLDEQTVSTVSTMAH